MNGYRNMYAALVNDQQMLVSLDDCEGSNPFWHKSFVRRDGHFVSISARDADKQSLTEEVANGGFPM